MTGKILIVVSLTQKNDRRVETTPLVRISNLVSFLAPISFPEVAFLLVSTKDLADRKCARTLGTRMPFLKSEPPGPLSRQHLGMRNSWIGLRYKYLEKLFKYVSGNPQKKF